MPFAKKIEQGLLIVEGRLLETGEFYDELTDSTRHFQRWILGEGEEKQEVHVLSSEPIVTDAMGDEYIDKHRMSKLVAVGGLPDDEEAGRKAHMEWHSRARRLGSD
jgi:hypothetical protein